MATSIERVLRHPEVVRLTRIPRSAEGRADMAHTRLYTTGRTLEMEQALRDMATGMAAETGHALPAQAIEEKIASLMERGYPLSEEQSARDPTRDRAGWARGRDRGCGWLGQDHDAETQSPISAASTGAR